MSADRTEPNKTGELTWDVTWADAPRDAFRSVMDDLLDKGWEPFAATPAVWAGNQGQVDCERLWFRRQERTSDRGTTDG